MALAADARGVLTSCASCGRANRLKYSSLDRATRCGQCHAGLSPLSAPADVPSAAVFDALLAQTSVPVVVDFWAPWCAPCRTMAPEVEKAARAMSGAALVVKVDTEAVPELGERYAIRSIPTLAVFRHGREVTRASGARPAAAIQALVSQAPAASTAP